MQAEVTTEEIRKTIFLMNKNRAPGLDGLSAGFYQHAWPSIGGDVVEGILEFFLPGRLLREVYATILTLIPKKNPTTMGNYRPVSCCNLIYKSIAKILANRFCFQGIRILSISKSLNFLHLVYFKG